jgi:pilus assembly protein CpaC
MIVVGVIRNFSLRTAARFRRRLSVSRAALCCLLPTVFLTALMPHTIAQQYFPQAPGQLRIPGQTLAASTHSPNIQQLLKSEYKLAVERRHSQLLITRSNVRRLAVTDSAICNYVQYIPKELAIVGLQLGTTDLMIWFEGEAVPAIYEITVVRDENLEEQRLSDFAKLERRLSDLFPNSNVYLVPVGGQVLLKGQAHDSEEATQILQIVRSEVQRSLGQVGGYGLGAGQSGSIQLASAQSPNLAQRGAGQFQDILVNMLEVPGEYNIKMRVVIAEVNRSQLRELGVDWNAIFNGRHSVGAALGGASGTTLSGIFENGDINVLLKWLATNKTATVLAEPTIVCMSGHPASLLAGGEFAVPTIIGLGGGQATSFRGIGTSMVCDTDRDGSRPHSTSDRP